MAIIKALPFFTSLLFIIPALQVEAANSKPNVKCGACIMLMNEAEKKIADVDPTKMTQIGSFRVDPKGNQYLEEVPYSRSLVHLTSIVEKACDSHRDYGHAHNPKSNVFSFTKLKDNQGNNYKLDQVDLSSSIQNRLKFACDEFLDDHEEDLIEFLKKPNDQPKTAFCKDQVEICSDAELVAFPEEYHPPAPLEPEADTEKDGSDSEDEDDDEHEEL